MIPIDSLIQRVIQQESGGNPNAVNPNTGASGLMQIMPATAASPGFGVAPMPWDQRFDPAANQRFGTDYMHAMLNRYGGDQARALAAYNWGPGNADKWDGDMASLPAETRNYITNILGGASPNTPAPQQPDELSSALATAMSSPETAKLFGMDTGIPKDQFTEAMGALEGPKMQPMQLQTPQRGPGYVKQTDGLARALEAFKATQAKRRA